MRLSIRSRIDYAFDQPADVLVQVEAAACDGQRILHAALDLPPSAEEVRRVAGHDGVGERILARASGRLTVGYDALVEVTRTAAPIATLPGVAPHEVPGAVVDWLMPSRYCPSDAFEAFVEGEFAGLSGGARAAAIDAYVRATIAYESGASDGATTAADTIVARRGVCRDFAHVVVTLARASGIPARVASGYAPGVTPPDFHLVAEVYLAGGWHVVDATGMAGADTLAIIGVGRDAADVAFLTSWGDARFVAQSVEVRCVA